MFSNLRLLSPCNRGNLNKESYWSLVRLLHWNKKKLIYSRKMMNSTKKKKKFITKTISFISEILHWVIKMKNCVEGMSDFSWKLLNFSAWKMSLSKRMSIFRRTRLNYSEEKDRSFVWRNNSKSCRSITLCCTLEGVSGLRHNIMTVRMLYEHRMRLTFSPSCLSCFFSPVYVHTT